MLSTFISWSSVLDLSHQIRLDVGRVRGGAIADYEAVLVDEAAGGELASAQLKDYPRWSEPTAGLIARAVHECTRQGTPTALQTIQPVRTLQIKVGLVPGGRGRSRHELFQLTADFRGTRAPVLYTDEESGGVWQREDLHIGSHDPLALVLQALSQWVWHTPYPRGWPAPLQVAELRSGDIRYVRVRDIPEPAQSAFRRRMVGATAPAIDGDRDVAYMSDWEDFLGGRM